jgi:hypothetical protein
MSTVTPGAAAATWTSKAKPKASCTITSGSWNGSSLAMYEEKSSTKRAKLVHSGTVGPRGGRRNVQIELEFETEVVPARGSAEMFTGKGIYVHLRVKR